MKFIHDWKIKNQKLFIFIFIFFKLECQLIMMDNVTIGENMMMGAIIFKTLFKILFSSTMLSNLKNVVM